MTSTTSQARWLSNKVLKICILITLLCILVSWALYGLFGYRIIEALYKGDSPAFLNKFMAGRSITPLDDYLRAADRLMFVSTLRAFTLLLFLLLGLGKRLMPLYVGMAVLLIAFIIFLYIEAYPSSAHIIHLDAVGYIGFQESFISDAVLGHKGKPFLNASLYESHDPHDYGMEAPRAVSHLIFDSEGFRNNNSTTFSDVVIVSDGMLNTGRDWEDTFSKRLQNHLSGRSVRSLSISGHGPFQYVQVLQTYGVKRKPKYAIFGFNEGNDIQDIHKCIQRKSGSLQYDTGGYGVAITDQLFKFTSAFSETWRYVGQQALRLAEIDVLRVPANKLYLRPRNLAWVQLPGRTFPIVFIDTQHTQSSDEIQKIEDWRQLRNTLENFKTICAEHAIVPIILFIPTAAHIYAEYSTDQSSRDWSEIRDEQIRAKANLENALERLSNELQISWISLSAPFQSAARNEPQLYDSYSVHLTSEGTELAARFVADALKSR